MRRPGMGVCPFPEVPIGWIGSSLQSNSNSYTRLWSGIDLSHVGDQKIHVHEGIPPNEYAEIRGDPKTRIVIMCNITNDHEAKDHHPTSDTNLGRDLLSRR